MGNVVLYKREHRYYYGCKLYNNNVAISAYYIKKRYSDRRWCEVIALFRKKSYKWNELEIIRKDCWSSGGQYATRVDGIVFSEKKRGKKGKVYSSYELYSNYVRSSRLDCFCIVFCDKSAKIKYIIKNHLDRSDVFKKPSEKILEQLSEWGVEVEEGENLRKERKQKGKQKVYDEIVRIRKEHKKNN